MATEGKKPLSKANSPETVSVALCRGHLGIGVKCKTVRRRKIKMESRRRQQQKNRKEYWSREGCRLAW